MRNFLRKISKRVEELLQGSTALKAHLVPQMKALSNLVPEIVNFGISVRDDMFCTVSDILTIGI
jgi:dynactin 1